MINIGDTIYRDDYQIWNISGESLVFPNHLISHIKANEYYKVLNNITEVNKFNIGERY